MSDVRKWEVFNVSSSHWFFVDEEWLGENIKCKEEIESLEMGNHPNEHLIVRYNDGTAIIFDNVYGTWGMGTQLV